MANAQKDEFKHFGMNLEFLLRHKADWRVALQVILFKEGDIVEHGEQAEKKATDGGATWRKKGKRYARGF